MTEHPVTLVSSDDLKRSRLTSLVRFLLVIPHAFVAAFYGIPVLILGVWLMPWIGLVLGRTPQGLHGFMAGWVRYVTRINAYANFLADPYPPFTGSPDAPYVVDAEIAPPERQNRIHMFLRYYAVIPAYFVAAILGYANGVVALVLWILAVVLGRSPAGLVRFGMFVLTYQTQTIAYLLQLTKRYPRLSF
ncbi:MAG: DUF4389 domain-containing protein [Thermoleophilia bacterium]